jgi:hypothetical protein
VDSRTKPLDDLRQFPLLHAIFGRRSRRFGLGMEIPSGPLAFTSRSEPVPLSALERAVLIAAGTGVTGWSFGVPYGPDRPDAHGHYTLRFTGRTAPTAAGIGTPVLFHTDDDGVYLTDTRDAVPPDEATAAASPGGGDADDDPSDDADDAGATADRARAIIDHAERHTVRLADTRLDLPSAPGHLLDPNLWMANAPGSTVFMPVGDASEQFLGILSIFVGNGYVIMDDEARRPAGELAPFIRSGLLDESRTFPLSVLQASSYEANCMELAMMAHTITLTLQAMGLGGLFYNGVNRWSVLGAFADDGIEGLGFRFVRDERWSVPNAVGVDGHLEALCPPYYADMRAAVEAFVVRKFGPGGAYDPDTPGAWKRSAEVKRSVTPYDEAFVDCLAEIAQYVFDKHGKFPGTITTMVLPCYVQAHHLDTEFYDEHYGPDAYLRTHAEHMARWHPEREPRA